MMRPAQRRARRRRLPGFPRSRGGRSRAGWWGVGLLGVAIFTVGAYFGSREERIGDRERVFATESHANSRAGYSFAYPPEWKLRETRSVARVVSPARDVSVSFGLGGRGDLQEASVEFVGELQEAYRKVSLTGFQLTLLDGEPAVAFTGSALSERGVPLRFQAVSVAGPRRNYGVSVFVAADADPTAALPRIQEILDSFRVSR
jgi:hypothetical protein